MYIHGKQDLLGRVLVNHGLITVEQLSSALRKQKHAEDRLGSILVKNGWLSERDLSIGISKQLMIPFVDMNDVQPEEEALRLIPLSVAERLEILPLLITEGALLVVISEPLNLLALDELRMFTGLEVKTSVSTATDIRCAISRWYKKKDMKTDLFDDEKCFRLGDILITSGLLSERQLRIALEDQKITHQRLGHIIMKHGFLNELQLTDALSKQLHIPMILLASHEPSIDALSLVPREMAENHQLLPVNLTPDGALKIAIAEPLSKETVQELRNICDREVEFAMALPSAIKREIPRFYRALDIKDIEGTKEISKGVLLGDILMNDGAITRKQLVEALDEQKINKMRIGEILIKNGLVSERQLAIAVSTQLDLPLISFDDITPSKEAMELVPINIAKRLEIIPVDLDGDILRVAIAEPLNLLAIDELRGFTGKHISLMVSSPSQIRMKMDQFYSGVDPDRRIII